MLQYWESSLPIRKAPNIRYKDDWEAFVLKSFRNAYNWFDIEQEKEFGSEEYFKTKVRTTYVINPSTGTKLSDDWKTAIFNVNNDVQMGRRYRYFGNIWLTVNTEQYGSPSNNCIIRRCNSFLAMKDKFGNVHQEPCSIDSNLKYGNIYYNNSVDIPQGEIKVWLQLNQYTKDIKINDRFILGYSEVYRIKTVLNYLSDYTFDPNGSPLMTLGMQLESKQIGDDFESNTTGSSPIVPISNDTNTIALNPPKYIIPQGKEIIYKCNFYNGNKLTNHTFSFNLMPNNIPEGRYLYKEIDENTFSIMNYRKYASEPVVIECKDLENEEIKKFHFTLGGEI